MVKLALSIGQLGVTLAHSRIHTWAHSQDLGQQRDQGPDTLAVSESVSGPWSVEDTDQAEDVLAAVRTADWLKPQSGERGGIVMAGDCRGRSRMLGAKKELGWMTNMTDRINDKYFRAATGFLDFN